ncbi:unnamed protein product [Auanema sp. JU1783]|nr:unnamed protein product [Auanema sp. JU1783]
MACLRKLKEDIAVLESLFPKSHERMQVLVASVDEISVKFIDNSGKSIIINANIQENYPRQPPIWFSESDHPAVGATLEKLTETTEPTTILYQIHRLLLELCNQFNLSLPSEIVRLDPRKEIERDEGQGSDMESDDDQINVDDVVEMADETTPSGVDEDVAPEGIQVLDRISKVNRQQHLSGMVQGSVTATDRLMKEIRDIYRSSHYKNGVYTIELHNDTNLYEWWVKLYKVDSDSPLAADLVTLAQEQKQDHIVFHFVFNENFPMEPPFVRLVSPTVQNGFVLGGGAICMELLTKQGWSSAYSVESVVLQIAATLVKGKARIQFDNKGQYSLARAQQSFKSLVQIHQKSGWYTPPKQEG